MKAPAASLAYAQSSVRDPDTRFPLWPPLLRGDPTRDVDGVRYPVEVAYDLDAVPVDFFDQAPVAALARWQALLPPLAPGVDLGAGGTPLVAAPELAAFVGVDAEVYVKDESQNPTWSHKDRLNAVAVSAAVHTGAPGVAVASSGNHGASAAAHAARAGLRCVVFASSGIPRTMHSLLAAYDASVFMVPRERRWELLNAAVERLGFHPVSNLTATHTGHPFGPEGYKTIAYELYGQLGGRAPAVVFVPTGYAELLYGVWKGFYELRQRGRIDAVPRMIACETERRALSAALRAGLTAEPVQARPTKAYSVATTVTGYRGIAAVRRSGGEAIPVSDQEMAEAARALRQMGLWQELSGAAGVAGLRSYLRSGRTLDGPVVCIATSSGFKNQDVGTVELPASAGDWAKVEAALARRTVPARV